MKVKKNHKSRNKCKDIVIDIKNKSFCAFCSSKDNLEFHHKDPKSKVNSVHRFMRNGSKSKMIKEIKKCIIVCRNCHIKIHQGRINGT